MEQNLYYQRITSILDLKLDPQVEKLGLSDNQISRIEGLESLIHLQKLWLLGNQISKIEGLESLTNLQVLWLANNKISRIEGLESLTNLQELSLEYNQITNTEVKEYKNYILKRNERIQWDIVQPQFLEYCLAIAPLNLPVLIQIEIFNWNSYDNHRGKKWKIAKYVKDIWVSKKLNSKFI